MPLLSKCGLQMWRCWFLIWPFKLEQFKSLTAIDTFSGLGGREVTLLCAVQEVPRSIPGSGKGFYVCF